MRICLKFLKISLPFYIVFLIMVYAIVLMIITNELINNEMKNIASIGNFVHRELNMLKSVLSHHIKEMLENPEVHVPVENITFVLHAKNGEVVETFGNSPLKPGDPISIIEKFEEGFTVSESNVFSSYLLFVKKSGGEYIAGIDVLKMLPNWIFNFESFKIIGRNGVVIFDSSSLSGGINLAVYDLTVMDLMNKNFMKKGNKLMFVSKPIYGIYIVGELTTSRLMKMIFDKFKFLFFVSLIAIGFLLISNCYILQKEIGKSIKHLNSILTFDSSVSEESGMIKGLHDQILEAFRKRIEHFRAIYAFMQKLYQIDGTEVNPEEGYENDVKRIFKVVAENSGIIFPNVRAIALYVRKGKKYKISDVSGKGEIFQTLKIIEPDEVEKFVENAPLNLEMVKRTLKHGTLSDLEDLNFYSLVIMDGKIAVAVILMASEKTGTEDQEELLKIIWMEINMAYSRLKRIRLLHKYSSMDYLTNIPNRRFFMERLREEIHRVERIGGVFAVSVIDVNWLKYVNDHFGHEAGDELLKRVASELKKFKRESDFVGRIGGDEFGAIWVGVGEEQVNMVEKRLFTHFDNMFLEPYNVEISISVGSAVYGSDGTTLNDLLKVADERMYERKKMLKIMKKGPRVKDVG